MFLLDNRELNLTVVRQVAPTFGSDQKYFLSAPVGIP